MPEADFKTVPDEVLPLAVAAEEYFANEGYDVAIEGRELGFPFIPTLVCKRDHETLIVECFTALDQKRLLRWASYSKSQPSDTRIAAVLIEENANSPGTAGFSNSNRIGVFSCNGTILIEVKQPVDLALNVDLPDLSDYSLRLRKALAPCFRKIRCGEWRDGLNDIYFLVEDNARQLLSGRIAGGLVTSLNRKGQPVSAKEVDDMSMGQLAYAYSGVVKKNQQESLIAGTLALMNPTRVQLIHKRRKAKAEEIIRAAMGNHVHAAIQCLEDVLK